MKNPDRYGILASIMWNSTDWTKPFAQEDLRNTKYDFVRDNGEGADCLNFGYKLYPAEKDGTYIGYTPMFKKQPREKDLGAVFFLSSDYQHGNRKCIVGVYAFPEIGEFWRKAKHRGFQDYTYGNVRAQVEDIMFFAKPVVIDAESVKSKNLLPVGRKISQQGFNYLTEENVVNILRLAARQNPRDAKLASLLERLGSEEVEDDGDGLGGLVDDPDAGTLSGIADLEAKMQKMKPEQKLRVSAYIERGRIATLAKRHMGYKCLLCEAMKLNPIGFLKENGDPYVEAHHVDQVANLAVGALGLANIITLCANHHRQMHYGNVDLLSSTKTQFKFQIDGKEFVIKKIKV
ncbi:hypothetical protein GCM10023172_01610 [Hymenobacter ginsengisoli]|uniref:HNH nuclease domain-containing protein n=1 Tax=Hymenobacter ginsengisoli TaxID=1051626 RepID=A0ABP8PW06_9BACT|nr:MULTISPECIES: hypothetical protein [unclassified Hymenobacter]MBO2033555.1 hypothetical protein [Hymenobacter sp. BT559]